MALLASSSSASSSTNFNHPQPPKYSKPNKNKKNYNNQRQNNNRPKRRSTTTTTSKRTQLQWLVNNVEKHYGNETSPAVWQALVKLASAQSPHHVTQAGQWLQHAGPTNCSIAVQERVIKATALTGLLHIALSWTEHVLYHSPNNNDTNDTDTTVLDNTLDDNTNRTALRLPSDVVQNALVSSLRKVARHAQLERIVMELGKAAIATNQSVSMSTFNLYLASLSDQALSIHNRNKNHNKKHQNRPGQQPPQSTITSSTTNKTIPMLLEEMYTWVTHPTQTQETLGVDVIPDAVSYATVLNVAAKTGNRTLSDQLWQFLSTQESNPTTTKSRLKNINAYNARLWALVFTTASSSSTSSSKEGGWTLNHVTQAEDDYAALELWQELVQLSDRNNNNTSSSSSSRDNVPVMDRYTIDVLLLPWERSLSTFVPRNQEGHSTPTNAWETIHTVLNHFCDQNSETIVSQAFESFLLRLCQGGATSLARTLFQTYIQPCFNSTTTSSSSTAPNTLNTNPQCRVKPTTEHFNILLGGYRKMLRESISNYQDNSYPSVSPGLQPPESVNELRSINVTGQVEQVNLRKEGWQLFALMRHSHSIQPDAVTITTMMGLCRTSAEVCQLLALAQSISDDEKSSEETTSLLRSNAIQRAALSRFGELGDVSSAFWMFFQYGGTKQYRQVRLWNVLLGAIQKSCEGRNYNVHNVVDIANAPVALVLDKRTSADTNGTVAEDGSADSMKSHVLYHMVDGRSHPKAAEKILAFMNQGAPLFLDNDHDARSKNPRNVAPRPDSQSYCLVASALQRLDLDSGRVIQMFQKAQSQQIPADGRFINALIRCFGENIDTAVSSWKNDIRPACVAFENRQRGNPLPSNRPTGKNLLAAYNGLMYCCGRALRPDLAVRLVYAMRKEGLEPSEVSLHSYNSGKRERPEDPPRGFLQRGGLSKPETQRSFRLPKPSWTLVKPYESVLYVECTKYDQNDKRRSSEKRVRIIV